MLGSYPKHKAGIGLALWSINNLGGPIAGPLLGGWISDNYSWPWIFYINVPIGLIAAWASWQLYKSRESALSKLPIDRMGLVLMFVWVAALRSEEHTSELQSLMRISYAGFVLKKKHTMPNNFI